MCGIAGAVQLEPGPRDGVAELRGILERMSTALTHRGPDDAGVWIRDDAAAGLAHRRLSILDLSAAGHQPMESDGGRYVISFNGEIYNHDALRQELQNLGYPFRSSSDTEVILAAVTHWGLQKATSRFVGMFAFALWDQLCRTMYLARDRLGEKPLYYTQQAGYLLFASELRALRSVVKIPEISSRGLEAYLRLGFVPAPWSMLQGVFKLEPACLWQIPAGGALLALRATIEGKAPVEIGQRRVPHCFKYWSLAPRSDDSLLQDPAQAIAELERTLRGALETQQRADVPLGAFLSGGIDSSLIAALLQTQLSRRLDTFTVAFESSGFDESAYARRVAEHLGTRHHEVPLPAAQLAASVPHLATFMDEPTANASYFAACALSAAARQEVKVCLSGDGADELFAGYERYKAFLRLQPVLRSLPAGARHSLGAAVLSVPPIIWRALDHAETRIRGGAPQVSSRLRAHKIARLLRAETDSDAYLSLLANWLKPPVRDPRGINSLVRPLRPDADSQLQAMTDWDRDVYLPDDALAKVDRASMASSLETRAPFLDYRVVELAYTMPDELKLRHSASKWIVRQLLYTLVPRALVNRGKRGFSAPTAAWLAGPLRDWAAHLIAESSSYAHILDHHAIKVCWRKFESGHRHLNGEIWSATIMLAWLSSFESVAVGQTGHHQLLFA